jgi:hypothetical protein
MNIFKLAIITTLLLSMGSCASSKIIVANSNTTDLSNYEYVVFGEESDGDRELDDIVLLVQNEITNTRLKIASAAEGTRLVNQKKHVLTPHINVKTEKWDGGHTYITISFYDFGTGQNIAVIKGSGIGLTISQDQNIALRAIRKKLQVTFN